MEIKVLQATWISIFTNTIARGFWQALCEVTLCDSASAESAEAVAAEENDVAQEVKALLLTPMLLWPVNRSAIM